MVASNGYARGRGRRASAVRRLALAVALAGLCLASGAKADALKSGMRAFARHDYVRAAALLSVEAERGSPVAQTYLGYMYEYGLGVPQDYIHAASWLHQAAEQGQPTGQFLLGLLFDKGFGVPQDWVEAEVWLNLAASQASSPRQLDYWISGSRGGRRETDPQSARRGSAPRLGLGPCREPRPGAAFGAVARHGPHCAGQPPRQAAMSQQTQIAGAKKAPNGSLPLRSNPSLRKRA